MTNQSFHVIVSCRKNIVPLWCDLFILYENSVAEPEPPGAATFRVEPEPPFLRRLRLRLHLFDKQKRKALLL